MNSVDQFAEFQRLLRVHIEQTEWANPPFQSTQWFLLRYLKRIETDAAEFKSPKRIDNSMRAMLRFYVDSIATDSKLADVCREILDAHVRALRKTPPVE